MTIALPHIRDGRAQTCHAATGYIILISLRRHRLCYTSCRGALQAPIGFRSPDRRLPKPATAPTATAACSDHGCYGGDLLLIQRDMASPQPAASARACCTPTRSHAVATGHPHAPPCGQSHAGHRRPLARDHRLRRRVSSLVAHARVPFPRHACAQTQEIFCVGATSSKCASCSAWADRACA